MFLSNFKWGFMRMNVSIRWDETVPLYLGGIHHIHTWFSEENIHSSENSIELPSDSAVALRFEFSLEGIYSIL